MNAPSAHAGRGEMRVAFAGTPAFALAALRGLREAGFFLPIVLTQPDRPAGRGLALKPSPVKSFALESGLTVVQPQGLRLDGKYANDAQQARTALQEARPDVIVVAAYGLILPQWTLELPRLGCLNIHASLLPRWRGAAPIQRAIEAGDSRTGITVMQMDSGLDTGDMLLVSECDIGPLDTAATLHDRLAALGADAIVRALDDARAGRLRPRPQPEAGVTYARKLDKAEAGIDWRQPASLIARRVRAFDPVPGCSLQWGGETVKLWRAQPLELAHHTSPGTLIECDAGRVVVACAEGALQLLEVQRPGARRQPVAALLQARPLPPGVQLRAGD